MAETDSSDDQRKKPPAKPPSPFVHALSQRLYLARERAGMSPQQLADAIGKNKTTIWEWENADMPNCPPPEFLARIAQTLRISLDWLLRPPGREYACVINKAAIRQILAETRYTGRVAQPFWMELGEETSVVYTESEKEDDTDVRSAGQHVAALRKRSKGER